MLSKENAHKAIEIMFEQAVKRMNELNDSSRQCLYEEYKERMLEMQEEIKKKKYGG